MADVSVSVIVLNETGRPNRIRVYVTCRYKAVGNSVGGS